MSEKIEMTSRFAETHRRQFIKTPLEQAASSSLKEVQAKILLGKEPTYPLHFTLAVVEIALDTPHTAYFDSDGFKKDVRDLYPAQTNFFVDRTQVEFAIMKNDGQTRGPESFAIVIDAGDAFKKSVRDFKDAYCNLVCEKRGLIRSERVFNEKYNYVVLSSDDGVEALRMPWSVEEEPICHVTLFTSFDLKRCNKPLFKKYEASGDKLDFLSKEVGTSARALLEDK